MILQLLSTQLVDSQFFQNITPCIDNFSLKKDSKFDIEIKVDNI